MLAAQDQRTRPALMMGGFYVRSLGNISQMDPMHPTNPPVLCIRCLTLGSVVMVSCVIVDLQEVKGEGKGEGGGREGRVGRDACLALHIIHSMLRQ